MYRQIKYIWLSYVGRHEMPLFTDWSTKYADITSFLVPCYRIVIITAISLTKELTQFKVFPRFILMVKCVILVPNCT